MAEPVHARLAELLERLEAESVETQSRGTSTGLVRGAVDLFHLRAAGCMTRKEAVARIWRLGKDAGTPVREIGAAIEFAEERAHYEW